MMAMIDAKDAGHTWFINDVPVTEELYNLYNAVRLKNPNLVADELDSYKLYSKDDDTYQIFRRARMVYSDAPKYKVGFLGHMVDGYVVQSRLIQNNKYASWNKRDHQSKVSKHMKNIVREAIKYLIPLQVKEIIEESDNRTRPNGMAHDISSKAHRRIVHNANVSTNILITEIQELLSLGYKPKTVEMRQAMEYVAGGYAKDIEDTKYKQKHTCVIIEDDGKVVVAHHNEDDYRKYDDIKELPEDMYNKLVVLMISPEQTYMRDIGVKDNATTYWVHDGEDSNERI